MERTWKPKTDLLAETRAGALECPEECSSASKLLPAFDPQDHQRFDPEPVCGGSELRMPSLLPEVNKQCLEATVSLMVQCDMTCTCSDQISNHGFTSRKWTLT